MQRRGDRFFPVPERQAGRRGLAPTRAAGGWVFVPACRGCSHLRGQLFALLAAAVVLLGGCTTSWEPSSSYPAYKKNYNLSADGYYRVRPGDTLHAIAFSFGLDWRDVARWNGIRSPYTIYPDQKLRMTPPPAKGKSRSATGSAKTAPRTAPAHRAPAPGKSAAKDPSRWRWPAEGRLVSTFKAGDPARNGIDISGREGQPVVASAAGEVVYSGSGLIGYGELIIVKHSERMLSAYAHNRKRLVSEGQKVSAGQRIAEMGRNGRNQPMLHFEIRQDGKPRDPLKYLPSR